MSEPKFKTKTGFLTVYSFLCGYVQREEKNGNYREMYMEHRHYHVKSGKVGEPSSTWEVFEGNELGKAKKHYFSIKL